jgi:GDPmannose 4,6-dehydratase
MSKRIALITGITGQDGSYLSEILLNKGYIVWGMHRRSSVDDYFYRLEHLKKNIKLIGGELTDGSSLDRVMKIVMPDEIYNLGGQSQVRVSFDQPHFTYESNWFGVERLLDSVARFVPDARVYQASTSEMFGDTKIVPQNEKTPFRPVSPYGVSKLKAHEAIKRARERGIYACGGILFNHESPRRGIEFVTRKFTDGIARIKLGIPQRETGKPFLEMGNLNSKRDWGFAGDYVRAMHLMLQQKRPDDFVIATGKEHSIRELIEIAASHVDIQIKWKGTGINEVGLDQNNRKIIAIDPKFFRAREVNHLRGDYSKAKKILGWEPRVDFNTLIKMMVENDLKLLKKQL